MDYPRHATIRLRPKWPTDRFPSLLPFALNKKTCTNFLKKKDLYKFLDHQVIVSAVSLKDFPSSFFHFGILKSAPFKYVHHLNHAPEHMNDHRLRDSLHIVMKEKNCKRHDVMRIEILRQAQWVTRLHREVQRATSLRLHIPPGSHMSCSEPTYLSDRIEL